MAGKRPHPAARARTATALASVGLFATIGGGIATATQATTDASIAVSSGSDSTTDTTTVATDTTGAVSTDDDWSATESTQSTETSNASSGASRSVGTSGGS